VLKVPLNPDQPISLSFYTNCDADKNYCYETVSASTVS